MSSLGDKSLSNAEDSEIESWLLRLEELYHEKGKEEQFSQEKKPLKEYLRKLKAEINQKQCSICKLERPHAVGGTGIIFEATHLNIKDQKLAFKFNRPLILSEEMSQVENERHILPFMDHSNIIRVFDVGELIVENEGQKLSYIVEPFIPDVKPLDQYIKSLLGEHKKLNAALADRILRQIVSLARQWVKALIYIHEQGYVYLDVKPDNAIVSKDAHLLVIDFGSVQKIDPNDNNTMEIFFDARFADPEILEKASVYSTSRVKKAIKRKDLKLDFDLYALGKAMLSLLKTVAEEHPHDLPQRPLFRSLHFLATRLLNGKNVEFLLKKGYVAGETFGSLGRSDYESIKYKELKDVLRDLEKEYGYWNPEDAVPELSTYSKNVVRVVPNINTVLTNRLKAIIEHPLVARLKTVTQLGLISLVYPTADHTRYDHVLGAFTYTASYVKSLFQDSQNPIFRNLVDEQDIKAVLLASLFHDLGQYPLAHDLGEVHPLIFAHSSLSVDLLSDPTKDQKGRTLLDIIKDGHDGWGVDPTWLKMILGAHTGQSKILGETDAVRNFKADMLSALIDGPIDADKADYIRRDSDQCRIPYGDQLDIERLLHVLTTVRIPGDATSRNKITIGVYEKGRASAESFGFARYLLHSSVYWHHTSRILKTMLQYATALILPPEVFQVSPSGNAKIKEIRENLLYFAKNLAPPFDKLKEETQRGRSWGKTEKPESPPTDNVFGQIAGAAGKEKARLSTETWFPGISWTDWLMLNWLKSQSKSSEALTLIESIQKRNLFKRACTIPRTDSSRELVEQLEKLSWPGRIELCKKVQERIYQIIVQEGPKIETRPLTTKDEMERLFKMELVILIDIPNPKKVTTHERPLVYVSELHRKTYYQETGSPVKADEFVHSLEVLMNTISPIRVLCHPDIHQWISICADQADFMDTICGLIDEVF